MRGMSGYIWTSISMVFVNMNSVILRRQGNEQSFDARHTAQVEKKLSKLFFTEDRDRGGKSGNLEY